VFRNPLDFPSTSTLTFEVTRGPPNFLSGGPAALDSPENLLVFGDLEGPEGRIHISGTVSPASAVPLPAALPLFGSGVLALAGVAWRRRGKVSG